MCCCCMAARHIPAPSGMALWMGVMGQNLLKTPKPAQNSKHALPVPVRGRLALAEPSAPRHPCPGMAPAAFSPTAN